MFEVGEVVVWESQSAGFTTEKIGEIYKVVPPLTEFGGETFV